MANYISLLIEKTFQMPIRSHILREELDTGGLKFSSFGANEATRGGQGFLPPPSCFLTPFLPLVLEIPSNKSS